MGTAAFLDWFRGLDPTEVIEGILTAAGHYLRRPANSYISLETASHEDPYTLIAANHALVSILHLRGRVTMIGDSEFDATVRELTVALSSMMSGAGHGLQVVYRYDPDSGAIQRAIEEQLDPMRQTMLRFGIERALAEEFTADHAGALARHCADEGTWIAVWTFPEYLPRHERRAKMAAAKARAANAIEGVGVQRLEMEIGLLDRHRAVLQTVQRAFQEQQYVVDLLDCSQAVREMRAHLNEPCTPPTWSPEIPVPRLDDADETILAAPPPVRLPSAGSDDDRGALLWRALPGQIIDRPAVPVDMGSYRYGDALYAPILISRPPRDPRPFHGLFSALRARRQPWQVSFWILGDGMGPQWLKSQVAGVLSKGSVETKRVAAALAGLQALQNSGEVPIVSWQATLMTWVSVNDKDPRKSLRQRVATLESTVAAWGNASTTTITGDPWAGITNCVPGLMQEGISAKAAAPLDEAVRLIPLSRPASPWDLGAFLTRSTDGRLLPYQPMSTDQDAWIDLGVSPMGGGKSVRQNYWGFAFLFRGGQTRIPYLSKIDIGPSSRELVNLVRELLPPDQKHLAIYVRLRMESRFAINPFDTALGCERPLPSHRGFLINLLSILCTPLTHEAPPDGATGLCASLIDLAYEQLSRGRSPNPYTRDTHDEIDQKLDTLVFPVDAATKWWEVVDFLFESGHTRLASIAQRYAVPTLSYLTSLLSDPSIAESNSVTVAETNERLAEFVQRQFGMAIEMFQTLASPTVFDLGEARIISLDLDEVAPKGSAHSDRQTTIMFMLARQFIAGKFFDQPEDVRHHGMPHTYRAHHARRITEIREIDKRLDIDEAHRFLRNKGAREQVLADLNLFARESRKWRLSVGLSTQSIGDIPDELIEFVTSLYVMGVGTPKDAERIADRFGLPPASIDAMLSLRKPTSAGSTMVTWHRSTAGRTTQIQMLTLGGLLLAALNSTTEDVQVGQRLIDIGLLDRLRLLSRTYPGGVQAEVARRRRTMGGATDPELLSRQEDVFHEIASELREVYRLAKTKAAASRLAAHLHSHVRPDGTASGPTGPKHV